MVAFGNGADCFIDVTSEAVTLGLYVQKTVYLTLDNNFGKCKPIHKILSQSDSWINFVYD